VKADLPVDSKIVNLDSTKTLEIVSRDEIQKIMDGKDSEIGGLRSRIVILEDKNVELENRIQDCERRLRDLE
jgi:hypothetical protein